MLYHRISQTSVQGATPGSPSHSFLYLPVSSYPTTPTHIHPTAKSSWSRILKLSQLCSPPAILAAMVLHQSITIPATTPSLALILLLTHLFLIYTYRLSQ